MCQAQDQNKRQSSATQQAEENLKKIQCGNLGNNSARRTTISPLRISRTPHCVLQLSGGPTAEGCHLSDPASVLLHSPLKIYNYFVPFIPCRCVVGTTIFREGKRHAAQRKSNASSIRSSNALLMPFHWSASGCIVCYSF